MVVRLWRQVSPFWHVITGTIIMLFVAGTYWGKVNAYDGRIIALEVWHSEQAPTIAAMKQEVDDLHEWMKAMRQP